MREVLAGLERAKTAMRAMGKYVPVDLVRRLYRDGREPVLGGAAADLTVLFTDIEGFTTIAESTPPDLLAQILGRYLDAMAAAIQAEHGTVDKYIGDAVMAFWNAPEPVDGHPLLALPRGAPLRGRPEPALCRGGMGGPAPVPDAVRPPPLRRPGGPLRLARPLQLHRDRRRREPRLPAGGAQQALRHRDPRQRRRRRFPGRPGRVRLPAAGPRGGEGGRTQAWRSTSCWAGRAKAHPPAARYEAAFALYQRGEFDGALALLEAGEGKDAPSLHLAERCRLLRAMPPRPGWDGVWAFDAK